MKNNKNIVVWSDNQCPPSDSVHHWQDPYENLLLSLGYDTQNPPIADLLKRYYGLDGDWFAVSPVYFHTTHNDSVIAQCGPKLDITDEQGQWYFDKISNFLLEEDIKLHYHSPTLWLGQTKNATSISSCSPAYLHNKSIMPYLEQLGQDMSWQKRITEVQMFLQSLCSPTQNNTLVNGIWFWGQGELELHSGMILSDDNRMTRLMDVWPDLIVQSSFDVTSLKKANHVFLTQYTNESISAIEKVCQSNLCHWYWNNVIYKQPALSWWQLFRRKWL